MSENTVVNIEPRIRPRLRARTTPKLQPKKSKMRPEQIGLQDILGAGPLALSAGVGQTVISYMEWRDRRKLYQTLLLIAGGLVLLFGVSRLVIQLVHS
jgi:hypothetical protein